MGEAVALVVIALVVMALVAEVHKLVQEKVGLGVEDCGCEYGHVSGVELLQGVEVVVVW